MRYIMANKIFKIYIQTILFLLFFLLVFSLCRIGFILHSGVINNGVFSLGNTNSFPFLDFIKYILFLIFRILNYSINKSRLKVI